MAKNLNKSRILISRVMIVALLLIAFCTASLFPPDTVSHELFDILGTILVAICALGRMYSTAFLGGFKNDTLITHGPFSIVRNPLYMFSLIGFAGVALMSGHIVLMVGVPLGFVVLYNALIAREEAFLSEKFGAAYAEYKKTTPRLIPSFKNYHVPETVPMVPKFLNKGFKDAIWWFAAFPVVEIAEIIQEKGIIKSWFLLP